MMEAVVCYKAEDGKVFQTEEDAIIHEAGCNFKKNYMNLVTYTITI